MERAGVSGRRKTKEMEEEAEGGSEHEGNLRNVNTIGKGASARSAEGGASASTIGEGANARSAEGWASASTLGKGASARRAKQTTTSRCRRVSRSSNIDPHFIRHVI